MVRNKLSKGESRVLDRISYVRLILSLPQTVLRSDVASREDARKLDLLERQGFYRNRMDAIRGIIHAKTDEELVRHLLNEKVRRSLRTFGI